MARKLYSVSFDKPEWKRIEKIGVTESLCCSQKLIHHCKTVILQLKKKNFSEVSLQKEEHLQLLVNV